MESKETQKSALNSPVKNVPLPSALLQYGTLALVTLLGGCEAKKEDFDPSSIADKLAPYAEGMDPRVKASFEEVLSLMQTDLQGIIIERSTFGNNPDVRASSTISKDYQRTRPITVTLSTNWDASNGLDLALLIHELNHVARLESERKIEDGATWSKRFGSTNGTEVRTELEAWELHLNLMDKESNGLMSKFYEELNKTEPAQMDSLFDTYLEKIALALNVREDQKWSLGKMLKTYVNYRLQKDKLNCAWSYKFVTSVASQYVLSGVDIYELDLNAADEGPNPSQCLYPLPNGSYGYKSYRPYEDRGNGMIGPRSKPVYFDL